MNIQTSLSKIKTSLKPHTQTIIAISKNASIEQIKEAYQLGIRHFGENRIQSLLSKADALSHNKLYQDIIWHFIGTIQSNKIRKIIQNCHIIESVYRIDHLKDIIRIASEEDKQIDILWQVKARPDPDKGGIDLCDLDMMMPDILSLLRDNPHVSLQGFMSILPLDITDSGQQEQAFLDIRQYRDHLRQKHNLSLPILSMGMSDDYLPAVRAGSTHIRLGRIIFGDHRYS